MNDKEMKKYIKTERTRLTEEEGKLTKRLEDIQKQLNVLDNLEKPYVAVVQSYSGGGRMAFKTLEQAEKKLEEYRGKTYFKNGLNYGVFLYKHNEDGTKEMIKEIKLQPGYRTPDITMEHY